MWKVKGMLGCSLMGRTLAVWQIIGVGAAVVGDMSSRPYWGLYELDFVFFHAGGE